MMPSKYTAPMSVEDALAQVKTLGVSDTTVDIGPTFKAILKSLEAELKAPHPATTEENIQARIRGVLLMALSNKSGKMVITTSNKSEAAVGYSTIYGDMVGGFSVLKDVYKTQIYALAKYRNQISPNIPLRVIERAPSAELSENQTDQDTLPPYDVLDKIIDAFMEKNKRRQQIIDLGFEASDVDQVISLITRNEYKRRQSAPGIKISSRAFDRDWRYPITSKF